MYKNIRIHFYNKQLKEIFISLLVIINIALLILYVQYIYTTTYLFGDIAQAIMTF